MIRNLIASLAVALLATTAFAQSQIRAEAENALRNAGVSMEIPEDATEEQLTEIVALSNSHDNPTQLEDEVKKMFGME